MQMQDSMLLLLHLLTDITPLYLFLWTGSTLPYVARAVAVPPLQNRICTFMFTRYKFVIILFVSIFWVFFLFTFFSSAGAEFFCLQFRRERERCLVRSLGWSLLLHDFCDIDCLSSPWRILNGCLRSVSQSAAVAVREIWQHASTPACRRHCFPGERMLAKGGGMGHKVR